MTSRNRAYDGWHDIVGTIGSLVIGKMEEVAAAARVAALEEAALEVEQASSEIAERIRSLKAKP